MTSPDLVSGRQLTIGYALHSRQHNPKNRAMRLGGRDDELASVTLDDHPTNGQSQSHPVRFGCKEGVKDAVRLFRVYSGSCILDFNVDRIVPAVFSFHSQDPTIVIGHIHGVDCILDQVNEDLL